MQIAKPFLRDGRVLQPGDPVPDGLDKSTLDHYKRYGMIVEPDKRAGRARQSPTKVPTPGAALTPAGGTGPADTKPTGPSESKPSGPSDTKHSQAHQADQSNS